MGECATPRQRPLAADELQTLVNNQQDHYAGHLAEVNKSNEVLATEDIVNSKGVLIAAKGTRIDACAANRLIQHKLLKPLEQQIQLKKSLDGNRLYGAFLDLLKTYKDLAAINDALDFATTYEGLLRRPHPPLIVQKLSVLAVRLPEWFEKALFTAWLSALLAREMGLDRSATYSALLAGLTHDVGFLHISPDIVRKEGRLSTEEWHAIQCHAVVGQVFLSNIVDIDPAVGRAVLEHHERCDGTGYPLGKMGEQLHCLGKIIGMADSIQAIRVNQFEKRGRNLRDALPYLQMNDTTHSTDVYRAMCRILSGSQLKSSTYNPREEIIDALAAHLRRRSRALQEIHTELNQFMEAVDEEACSKSPSYRSLAIIVNHILNRLESSGLTSDGLLEWLTVCAKEGDRTASPELNEIELMQNELVWHLNNLRRVSDTYLDELCDGGEQSGHSAVRQLTTGLAALLESETPEPACPPPGGFASLERR